MRKLPKPNYDDTFILKELSENNRIGSYPQLRNHVVDMNNAYQSYDTAKGNALNIQQLTLPPEIQNHLKRHYKSPNKQLSHIRKMRLDSGASDCPMCGSMHCSTLDHVLPCAHHPSYAIYSRNLVPACNCNSKRSDDYIGTQFNQRILHPYYDECLKKRLFTASFDNLDTIAKAEIKVQICIDDADFHAVQYHVSTVVERTYILKYLEDRFIKMCRKPSLVIRKLLNNPVNLANLEEILRDELATLDEQHGGKNNWNSVFITGLLEASTLQWIFEKFNIPARINDSPLHQ
jgi:hypothetical protein